MSFNIPPFEIDLGKKIDRILDAASNSTANILSSLPNVSEPITLNLSLLPKEIRDLTKVKPIDIEKILKKDRKKQQKILEEFEEKRTKKLTDFSDTRRIIDIIGISKEGIVKPPKRNPKYPEPGNRDINGRIVMTEDGRVSDKAPKP